MTGNRLFNRPPSTTGLKRHISIARLSRRLASTIYILHDLTKLSTKNSPPHLLH
nr:MAG TPA: hypothetical protein [Caudoviricetes sp.]